MTGSVTLGIPTGFEGIGSVRRAGDFSRSADREEISFLLRSFIAEAGR